MRRQVHHWDGPGAVSAGTRHRHRRRRWPLPDVKRATARFANVALAQAAGYEEFLDCFDSEAAGWGSTTSTSVCSTPPCNDRSPRRWSTRSIGSPAPARCRRVPRPDRRLDRGPSAAVVRPPLPSQRRTRGVRAPRLDLQAEPCRALHRLQPERPRLPLDAAARWEASSPVDVSHHGVERGDGGHGIGHQ